MKYIYIVFIFTIVLACKNKPDNLFGREFKDIKEKDYKKLETDFINLKTIKINPKYNRDIKLSKLLDTTYTILLETNKNSLIGKINKTVFYKDRIYILDKEISKAVFVFDMKGKYLMQIGQRGHGPGEFAQPDDFEIDEENKEILIPCHAMRKIFRFDFNGNFLGDSLTEITWFYFKTLKNGNLIFQTGEQSNNHLSELKSKQIYITNRNQEIIAYGPDNRSFFKNLNYMVDDDLMAKNNEITYGYKLSDTIYSITEEKIFGKYRLDFGKYSVEKEKISSMNYSQFYKELLNNERSAYFMGAHFETSNYLYFHYSYKNSPIICFYNKKNNRILQGKMINDTSNYPLFSKAVVGTYKEYFVSSINAHNIISMGEYYKKNHPKYYDKFLEILHNVKELKIKKLDNPILLVYKFKDKYEEE